VAHFFFRRRVRRLLIALVTPPLLVLGIFWSAVAWWPYPRGIAGPPAAGTFFVDRSGHPLAAFASIDGQWQLPLNAEQISPHLIAAIVAVEDERFYGHHGVDWRSVAGSAWEDVRHLGVRRGASTLTMQLQRLRDPRPRTLFNKFEQAVRAEQIERNSSKQDVVVEYLNRAPFGGNLVGAGAASWRYFGKPCRDLSLSQAAMLAGLPQSPNRLRPDRHPTAAKGRRDHVLERMLAARVISQSEYDRATAEPIDGMWLPLPQEREIGLRAVLQTLSFDCPGRSGALSIDSALQEQVFHATADRVAELSHSGVTAAAVVVVDTPSGECLAAVSVGGKDVDLTSRPRSTGSTLKPLIYAAAFDAGACGPSTLLNDSPSAWPGYSPANYDAIFRGPMTASVALAESRNIPALVVLQKIGVSRAIGAMQSFGLRGLNSKNRDFGLSLAIGGAEASPMELAEAYATLARGGIWRRVTLAERPSLSHRAMREEPCWQVMRALSGDERTGAIAPEAVASHVAWKTGTSSGHRDAWCAAVTPNRTVVVWLGNPDGKGSDALIGADAAAPLALQLIANLDTGNAGWPTRATAVASSAAPSSLDRSHLIIASPQRGQSFVMLDELPADRQRVKLEAAGEGQRWWFIDDNPVGTGRIVWWTPSDGEHRVRVVDEVGRSASAEFKVHVAANSFH
jgi:penicillin-binding protein 1C